MYFLFYKLKMDAINILDLRQLIAKSYENLAEKPTYKKNRFPSRFFKIVWGIVHERVVMEEMWVFWGISPATHHTKQHLKCPFTETKMHTRKSAETKE